MLKLTLDEMQVLNGKRKFFLELEQKLEEAQEQAVLGEHWEEASRFQNRINLVFRVRQRLESGVWSAPEEAVES